MARIKGRHTLPEKLVRSCLRKLKIRFRGHVKVQSGTPDFVLLGQKKAVFVHGCFWHGHKNCPRSSRPTTNTAFWNKKIDGNIRRDRKLIRELKQNGWAVLVIWQCQTKNEAKLLKRLQRFSEKI